MQRQRPYSSANGGFFNPPGSRVINVLAFGADPDGKTDSTLAIQRAITQALNTTGRYNNPAFVYFPSGEYLISDTLASRMGTGGFADGWRAGLILMGESTRYTVIKLIDYCPGFTDKISPKPMIKFGSEEDKTSNPNGGGNRAFRHSVLNLTLEVGRGNTGAIGIDYIASNRGTIKNVIIKDNAYSYAQIGIKATRQGIGPCLIENVEIVGFEYGLQVDAFEYLLTCNNLIFRDQRSVAVTNVKNSLVLHKCVSYNSVPFLITSSTNAFTVLEDIQLLPKLSAGSDVTPVGDGIKNAGTLYVSRLINRQYSRTILDTLPNPDVSVTDRAIKEYTSRTPETLWQTGTDPKESLPIQYVSPPAANIPPLSKWANIDDFGAVRGTDSTSAIQRALDSGAEVVCAPNGNYTISSSIFISSSVKRIMGFQTQLTPAPGFTGSAFVILDAPSGTPESNPLHFEWLYSSRSILNAASNRTVVISHCDFDVYTNDEFVGGNLHVVDSIVQVALRYPQNVYAMQLNTENEEYCLDLVGGTSCVVGFKTEGISQAVLNTNVRVRAGGKLRLIGAAFLPLRLNTNPAIELIDSQLSASWRVAGSNSAYDVLVRETRGAETRDLTRAALATRNSQVRMSLFCAKA